MSLCVLVRHATQPIKFIHIYMNLFNVSAILFEPPHAITLSLLKECSDKTNRSHLEMIQRNAFFAPFSPPAILKNYISCMMSSSK